MSNFFIKRPIVAIVISILMVIVGAITIIGLPVAQFPDIAPPEIRIWALYPGADAETLEKAVATPIEQQINGVDNMDYMYSLNSTNNSSTAIHGSLAKFFDLFNRMFERGSNFYVGACRGLIRKSAVALVALAGFAVAGVFFGKVLPSSFLPDEDQGYMYIQMQLPEASSLQSTSDAAREVEAVLKDTPGVKYTSTVMG